VARTVIFSSILPGGVNQSVRDSLKLVARAIFQLPDEVTEAERAEAPEILR